ncbi:cell cycle histidine kinase CckA [Pseudorhodoplanes sinuspersici]|uniref:histidine kinase n=1 Tax=Pseudorhodoplanes sinuspersici TaxID=1235591 RepID=A0A1W6ZU12_9HYPH|nr:response regulator [Pseudorhodoplanes sinuspersici]ARQ00820.1 hybrid sensor histidine kinase/response regulator [Pseudorhodoplanes sinuspersici]RKE72437.1 two-component system cell cycle sensor histidine kinase/response regulator CckA [Pseudorhodoplanes sinuspersici]
MTTTDMGEMRDPGSLDRSQRGGSIGLVIVIAIALVGAAVGLLQVGRGNTSLYILILLAILGTVGVFSLFALAAGILRFAGQDSGNPMIRGLVDGAFDGILVTDSSGRVVYANAAYLNLIGAASAKDARPIERVFIGDPDVSEAVYRLLKAAREGRRLQEEVRVGGLKDEPARWLRLRVRPGDAGRNARTTVWTVADVTRDREKQENVFQELQHAIDYLDHAPAGFFSADAAGNIVYLNATLASWLDQDLAEVGSGGLKLTDVVSGEGASLLAIPPEPGDVKTEILDLDFKTRSGLSVPVRLFHKVAFGADGVPGPSRTLVLNRARGEQQDAQRAAEVRFMRFFNNTPMAIATVDRSGRIMRSNALFARLFKGAAAEGPARSILSTVAERDRSTLEHAIAKASEGQGDIAPVEAALSDSSDKFATFFLTAIDDDGERDSETAIIYALDTTERRALEGQIKQQQKMDTVGQLAGGIAHDFNNVLSAIMMATDFLLSAHKPTDPSFSDIMQIKQNANRAASLVRQLLAFSRRQTLRPQVLDLGEVLSDLGMLLKRLIGEKVKLDVVHTRDLWPVKADLSQFEQVVVNLVVNARDAMPDGGKLTIRTANMSAADIPSAAYKGMPSGDYVLVEVTDSGTGMSAEVLTQIFEPFFSTKEVGKGTGLGLSTVYGIVKQTGGFIYPESEVGKGTVFRIFLPRHIPEKEEIKPADAPAIAALTSAEKLAQAAQPDLTGHGTVLLVEDEEGLRALNARGLASRGYTVLTASNGVEALEELERNEGKVDLVVSDVVMPEMDGPTLLKEMRKTNPDLKMIFVSGYAEEAFEKNLPQGPDRQFKFLAKPFTLKQLVEVVKETLAK